MNSDDCVSAVDSSRVCKYVANRRADSLAAFLSVSHPRLAHCLRSAWVPVNAAWYMSHYLQKERLFWEHTLNSTVWNTWRRGETLKDVDFFGSSPRLFTECGLVFVKYLLLLSHISNVQKLTKCTKLQLKKSLKAISSNRTNRQLVWN